MRGYSLLFSRLSVLPADINPEELGGNDEYLRTRKKRRDTAFNIWELQAVLNEEVNDDIDFITNLKKTVEKNLMEEEEEEKISEEASLEADEFPEQDIYTEEGLNKTHL